MTTKIHFSVTFECATEHDATFLAETFADMLVQIAEAAKVKAEAEVRVEGPDHDDPPWDFTMTQPAN